MSVYHHLFDPTYLTSPCKHLIFELTDNKSNRGLHARMRTTKTDHLFESSYAPRAAPSPRRRAQRATTPFPQTAVRDGGKFHHKITARAVQGSPNWATGAPYPPPTAVVHQELLPSRSPSPSSLFDPPASHASFTPPQTPTLGSSSDDTSPSHSQDRPFFPELPRDSLTGFLSQESFPELGRFPALGKGAGKILASPLEPP